MLLIKYLKNIGNIGQVRCLLTEQKEIATLEHNLQRAFDLLNRSEDCKYLMSEINHAELQKRADRADQSVLFFLAAKNRRKHAKTGKNRRFFGANFWGGKLVGANFYAFCNYGCTKSYKYQVYLEISL